LALCLVKRFPKLITVKSREHKMSALELLIRKPFAFRSGTKLTWWQDRIYSLIQVRMDSVYDRPIKPDTYQSSECTERDVENPPESKPEESLEVSAISDKGFIMNCLAQ
ncbi:hypothetical protein MKW94_006670, partial [Papaver nudicaule]|nr:hypothetical protein [Papaver nudicaule]